MLDEFKDVLSKASSKGDVAVVLIAGTAGFLIDAGLNAIGFLEPGAVGVTFASGALGIKKGIEASTEKSRTKKRERKEFEERVARLQQLLDKQAAVVAVQTLTRDAELYGLGLLSKEEFEKGLAQLVEKLRKT